MLAILTGLLLMVRMSSVRNDAKSTPLIMPLRGETGKEVLWRIAWLLHEGATIECCCWHL